MSEPLNFVDPNNLPNPPKLNDVYYDAENDQVFICTDGSTWGNPLKFTTNFSTLISIDKETAEQIDFELTRATSKYGPMKSAHEGYAIIKEELEELWAEIKVKQALHDKAKMRAECIQLAAMTIRFIQDICENKK